MDLNTAHIDPLTVKWDMKVPPRYIFIYIYIL